jgi:hypothetical protein
MDGVRPKGEPLTKTPNASPASPASVMRMRVWNAD